MQVVLTIQNGPDKGQNQVLRPGDCVCVGQPGKSDWGIREDALLSAAHFVLECGKGRCRLHDLDSPFGTLVNSKRVTEAVLRDGDRIVAGWTTFTVRVEANPTEPAPPLVPACRSAAATEKSPQDALPPVLKLLRSQPDTLYALLDAARDPKVLRLLRGSRDPHQSLYEGSQGEVLADFAPYLVQLSPSSKLLEQLAETGWGQSWGVFLTSYQSFKEVRRHLRRFLLVKFEDGREAYFRFYDPRVLRVYLPTCTPGEVQEFFGPVTGFVLEDEQPATAWKLTAEPRGLKCEVVPLATVPAKPVPAWERGGHVAYSQPAVQSA